MKLAQKLAWKALGIATIINIVFGIVSVYATMKYFGVTTLTELKQQLEQVIQEWKKEIVQEKVDQVKSSVQEAMGTEVQQESEAESAAKRETVKKALHKLAGSSDTKI